MPEKETIERARKDARQGKSRSTQAGEFVRDGIVGMDRKQDASVLDSAFVALGFIFGNTQSNESSGDAADRVRWNQYPAPRESEDQQKPLDCLPHGVLESPAAARFL